MVVITKQYNLFYDPRPGYPFNYWVRNELNKIKYTLLKYSAIYAEYEKQTGV